MQRRIFLSWVGLGLIASSLPVAIAACSPDSPPSSSPSPAPASPTGSSAGGFTAVGTVANLDKEGFIQDKKFAAGPVVVVRDPKDANKVVALNPTCSHRGCLSEWKDQQFICPCHGSKFAADGSLVEGPAQDPLQPYDAKIEGDSVLVKSA